MTVGFSCSFRRLNVMIAVFAQDNASVAINSYTMENWPLPKAKAEGSEIWPWLTESVK